MQLDLLIQQRLQGQEEIPNKQVMSNRRTHSSVHFIETAPSVLRDVPLIQLQEHKVCNCNIHMCISDKRLEAALYVYMLVFLHIALMELSNFL